MKTDAAPPSPEFVSAEIAKAVAIITAQPGVERIWFFGSAAEKRGNTGSDLDFAVEGLPRNSHFGVVGELLLALRTAVDLVRWEEASDALRASIVRQGTVIYAA